MEKEFEGYMPAKRFAENESKKNNSLLYVILRKPIGGGIKYIVSDELNGKEKALHIFDNAIKEEIKS